MGERLEIEGTSALIASEARLSGNLLSHAVHVEYLPGTPRLDEAFYPYHPSMSGERFVPTEPEDLPATVAEAPILYEVPRVLPIITARKIHEILDKRNKSTPSIRIARLMQLAFDAEESDKTYEPLPSAAEDAAMNIQGWLDQTLPGPANKPKRTRLDEVRKLMHDKFEYEYLYEDTAGYEHRYEWVANVEKIARIMGVASDETRVAATAVRMIVQDAAEVER